VAADVVGRLMSVAKEGVLGWAARPLRRLYAWVLHWAETPYGGPALAGISFAESSLFPIPPDVLQIALSLSRPHRSFHYAAISTVASVLGAVAGWLLGYAAWTALSGVLFSYVPGITPRAFEHVRALYEANAFVAICTAAFTPIPFKVFTLASGVFGVPLATLVAASILGRAGRFFAVATVIYWLGSEVRQLLERYFELVTLILAGALIGGLLLVRFCL
jgi:membrane protein YqaA with SNARE-associated domain